MNLFLAFLVGTFLVSFARGDRADAARPRRLPLLLVCLLVAVAMSSARVVG